MGVINLNDPILRKLLETAEKKAIHNSIEEAMAELFYVPDMLAKVGLCYAVFFFLLAATLFFANHFGKVRTWIDIWLGV